MAPARATRARTRTRQQSVSSSTDELASHQTNIPSSPIKPSAVSPLKPKRSSIPPSQTKEIIIQSPKSALKDGSPSKNSPWRVRVTVETDDYNTQQPNMSPSATRSTTRKIPLNDTPEGARPSRPSRARPRPRKRRVYQDDAEDQLIFELSNDQSTASSPKKPRSAKRKSDAGLTPAVRRTAPSLPPPPASPGAEQRDDQPSAAQPRKRIDFSQMTPGSNVAGSASRLAALSSRQASPSKPLTRADASAMAGGQESTSLTEEQEFEEIEKQAETEAIIEQSIEEEEDGSPPVEYDEEDPAAPDEDREDADGEESTIALDRSLAESEEFTMVSLESLRNQKALEAAEPPEKVPTVSGATAVDNDRLRPPSNDQTPRLSKSPSAPPSIHSSPRRRSVPRQSPAAVEAGVALQTAVGDRASVSDGTENHAFSAFGPGTQRDLRHGFMIGELLSRSGNDTSLEQPASAGRSPEHAAPRRPAAGVTARLPTPEDSNLASSSSSVEPGYDAMSWKATSLPRQVGSTRSYDASSQRAARPKSRLAQYDDVAQDPEEEELVEDDQGDPMDIDSLPQSAVAETSAQEAVPSYPPQTEAQPIDEGEPRRMIIPFNKNAEASPVPSLSDLLPADDRPTRGKIPRTWRRVTGEDSFLYSDETASPAPQKKSAFASPGAFFEDMASRIPSIFRRVGASASKDQDVDDRAKRVSDPTPTDRPLRGILSSPLRRASSPAKEVRWRADQELEDVTEHPARDGEFSSGSESPSSELGSESESVNGANDSLVVVNGDNNDNDDSPNEEAGIEELTNSVSIYPSSPPLPLDHRQNTHISQNPLSVQHNSTSTSISTSQEQEQDSTVDSSEVRSIKRSLAAAMASSNTPSQGRLTRSASASASAAGGDSRAGSVANQDVLANMPAIGVHGARRNTPRPKGKKRAFEDPGELYPFEGHSIAPKETSTETQVRESAGGPEEGAETSQEPELVSASATAASKKRKTAKKSKKAGLTPVSETSEAPQEPEPAGNDIRSASIGEDDIGETRPAIAAASMPTFVARGTKLMRAHEPLPAATSGQTYMTVEADPASYTTGGGTGPFAWTPNHAWTLRSIFHVFLHDNGIQYPRETGEVVKRPCWRELDSRIYGPAEALPAALRGFIGRTINITRECPVHENNHQSTTIAGGMLKELMEGLNGVASLFGSRSEYAPREDDAVIDRNCREGDKGRCPYWTRKVRYYKHAFTETDARIAWAFALFARDAGVPLVSHETTWETYRLLVEKGLTLGGPFRGHCSGWKKAGGSVWVDMEVRAANGHRAYVREDWLREPPRRAAWFGLGGGRDAAAKAQLGFVMMRIAHLWAAGACGEPKPPNHQVTGP